MQQIAKAPRKPVSAAYAFADENGTWYGEPGLRPICAYNEAPTFIAFEPADKYNPLTGQVLTVRHAEMDYDDGVSLCTLPVRLRRAEIRWAARAPGRTLRPRLAALQPAGTGRGRRPGRACAPWCSRPAGPGPAQPPQGPPRCPQTGEGMRPVAGNGGLRDRRCPPALLRLLHLQQATRRAVRGHQDEAATMLARVAIERISPARTASTSRAPWRGCRTGA